MKSSSFKIYFQFQREDFQFNSYACLCHSHSDTEFTLTIAFLLKARVSQGQNLDKKRWIRDEYNEYSVYATVTISNDSS